MTKNLDVRFGGELRRKVFDWIGLGRLVPPLFEHGLDGFGHGAHQHHSRREALLDLPAQAVSSCSG